MKKYVIVIFSIIMLCTTGCSTNKEEPAHSVNENNIPSLQQESIYEIEKTDEYIPLEYKDINIDEYITLGEYKHVIDTPDISVSEEELQQEIEFYLESYSIDDDKILSGTVKDGDKINVHYTIATEDMEQSFNDCNIYIGYEMIAPGIDSKLIGLSVGDIKTYSITYPENYSDNNLSGKNANITITINYILGNSINSEWNDDFVSLLTNNEYSDTSSFEEVLKDEIMQNKKNQYYSEILEKIVSNATISGNIENMVNVEYQNYLKEFNQYMDLYNLNREETAQSFGFENFEEFENLLKEYSENYVKEKLVIYKIAKDYDIKITYDEYNEYINELHNYYSEEEINEFFSEEYLKYYLLYEKVMEKLLEFQL